MNRAKVVSQQEAALYCPRSPQGETKVITGTTTKSTTLIKKLSQVASASVCGGCSYSGKTRVEGEQVLAAEMNAKADRVNAETALLEAQADQILARAEIARKLEAAGLEIPAGEIAAPSETSQVLPLEPTSSRAKDGPTCGRDTH